MATAAEILADIEAVRAARTALAKGERIEDVWREGRRLTFGKVTVESLTNLLAVLQQDYDAAAAEEGISALPARRRSALTPVWNF